MVTTEAILWMQIASIITYVIALFVLYRILVQQKDATIQMQKENIAFLKDRLEDLKSQSPDVLLQSLTNRNKFFEEELSRLKQDNSTTQEQLDVRETELKLLRQAKEGMEYLASRDALTGLYNRRSFLESASKLLYHADKDNKLLAFLTLDLDSFKPVNDNYGHSIGDKLLIALAERLEKILGGNVLLARAGGDEFVSIVEYVDLSTVKASLIELVGIMAIPFLINDQEICVGASIGVSLYPQHGRTTEDLLRISGEAMYQAKHQGRGRYVIAS